LSNKQENEIDGNYLVVLYTLSYHNIKIDSHALVDCGCTGFTFMNEAFTCQHNHPRYEVKNPKTVKVINSHPISSGDITEYVEVQCIIEDYYETLTAYITSLGYYPLILGIPWLKRHDITINFTNNNIQFSSPGCLPYHTIVIPIPIKGLTTEQGNRICAISAMILRHIINHANKHYGNVEWSTLSLNEISTSL
jgi:hypothetical protein